MYVTCMSKLSYATLYIRIHFYSARIFHLKCLLGYYINVTIDVTFEVRIYISLEFKIKVD